MQQQFLTSGEAAKILGLTPDGVRALERRGEIKALKTPTGRRLFLKSDVETLAESRAKVSEMNAEQTHMAGGKFENDSHNIKTS